MLDAAPVITAASEQTAKAAIVLPAGWTRTWWLGAVELGLWGPVPIRSFTDPADAWAWLNAPKDLLTEVEKLQEMICSDRKVADERAAAGLRAALEKALRADPTLTIESVASTLRCSTRSLQRALRAAGDTFASMRVRVRVETASELLIQGDSKVETIASTVGFRSRSHFVSWFRGITGHTPREFRRVRRAGVT